MVRVMAASCALRFFSTSSTAGAIRSARQRGPTNSGTMRVSDTRLTSVTVSISRARLVSQKVTGCIL